MLLERAKTHQVARYFYQIMVLDLNNLSRSVEESAAFCVSLLRGLKHTQAEVLQLWYENFDALLPQISSQEDFSLAVRMARILDHKQLDPEGSERLLRKLAQRVSEAMAHLPDDLWRVRVLAQLTKQCIRNVFERLDPELAESIKTMSHNALGGDKVLKAIGMELVDD